MLVHSHRRHVCAPPRPDAICDCAAGVLAPDHGVQTMVHLQSKAAAKNSNGAHGGGQPGKQSELDSEREAWLKELHRNAALKSYGR